ncbi:MAG: hypothetical protein AB7T14_05730 [Candidatus Methylacidiphilaceae bacterium]
MSSARIGTATISFAKTLLSSIFPGFALNLAEVVRGLGHNFKGDANKE